MDKGINCIFGENDAGKTAIFRALRVVFLNKPNNLKNLIKNGESDFKIEIETVNPNFLIKRTLKKYVLKNLDTKEVIKFKAFGKEVPNPIKNILDLKPVNQQYFLEPYFLMLQSGGSVSKALEKSLGNEDFQKVMETVKSDLSETKSEIKNLKRVKEENSETVTRLKEIKTFKKKISNLIEKEKKYSNLVNKYENISELLNKLQNIKIKNIGIIKKIYANISNLESQFIEFWKLQNDFIYLENALQKLEKAAIIEIDSFIFNAIDNLEYFTKKLYTSINEKKEIEELLNRIEQPEVIQLQILKDEFNNLISKYGCPLCGSKTHEISCN